MRPLMRRVELVFFEAPEIGSVVKCRWCDGNHEVTVIGGLPIIKCIDANTVGIITVLQQRDVT